MRIPWSRQEVKDAARLSWIEFHGLYPDRTYDAYEVKRRRVPGGSAGRGRADKGHQHSVRCHCKPMLVHFPGGTFPTLGQRRG